MLLLLLLLPGRSWLVLQQARLILHNNREAMLSLSRSAGPGVDQGKWHLLTQQNQWLAQQQTKALREP
jgi:hypothetical protein